MIDQNILLDRAGLLQLTQADEVAFDTLRFEELLQSRVNTWPTDENDYAMYKFNGVAFTRSNQLTSYERQTYSLLELLGDVGGLFDGLTRIIEFLITPSTVLFMKQSLVTRTFMMSLNFKPG